MTCKLCGVQLTASNKCEAHIFPRSLLRVLSPEEYGQLKLVGTDMDRSKRRPIGSYDKNILCSSCDSKIGIYDSYAKVFVTNKHLVPHPSGAGWTMTGVDQGKLKLFCISYIWRASITTLEEFNRTSAGAVHEEAMRLMILDDNPATPSDYTTSVHKFVSIDGKFEGILFPARTRINDINHYEAYLPNGYKFWVKVDSRNDELIDSLSVGAVEPMFIGHRGDYHGSIEKNIMVKAARRSQG
jgi:hypothetical protein